MFLATHVLIEMPVDTMDYAFCSKCGKPLKQSSGEEWDFECSECGQKVYSNPTPVVAALVFLEDRLVVVSSKNKDLWGLPGGYVSTNESLEQAVVREVFEETNLHVKVTGFHASYPMVKSDRNLLFIVFKAEVDSGEPRAGDDVKELKILDPKEAYQQLTGKYAMKAVDLWMKQKSLK